MADRYDACSDRSTVGLQFGGMSPTNVADISVLATHVVADVGDTFFSESATTVTKVGECE